MPRVQQTVKATVASTKGKKPSQVQNNKMSTRSQAAIVENSKAKAAKPSPKHPSKASSSSQVGKVQKSRKPEKTKQASRQNKPTERAQDFSISRAPFSRLVKEVLQEIRPNLRIGAEAVEALQTNAEAWLLELFKDTDRRAKLATPARKTIKSEDLKMAIKAERRQQQKSARMKACLIDE